MEIYFEEVVKDFSILFGRFILFVDLVVEFLCDLDDVFYKVIDIFFRVFFKLYIMRCFFVLKWFSVLSYDLICFLLWMLVLFDVNRVGVEEVLLCDWYGKFFVSGVCVCCFKWMIIVVCYCLGRIFNLYFEFWL